jgi:esterase/lipase
MRIGTGVALQDGFLDLQANLEDFNLPFFFAQGDLDTACSAEGAKTFHDKCSSKDKELKVYKNTHHELIFEPNKDEIKGDIWGWVKKRM